MHSMLATQVPQFFLEIVSTMHELQKQKKLAWCGHELPQSVSMYRRLAEDCDVADQFVQGIILLYVAAIGPTLLPIPTS
jgi:hypothetical protein